MKQYPNTKEELEETKAELDRYDRHIEEIHQERKVIIKSLEKILSTPKGERVFFPTFGKQLKDLIVDDCDEELEWNHVLSVKR